MANNYFWFVRIEGLVIVLSTIQVLSCLLSAAAPMCDLAPLTGHLQISDYVFKNGILAEIDLVCDSGQLEGNDTLTCGADGQWSSVLPTCVSSNLTGR